MRFRRQSARKQRVKPIFYRLPHVENQKHGQINFGLMAEGSLLKNAQNSWARSQRRRQPPNQTDSTALPPSFHREGEMKNVEKLT